MTTYHNKHYKGKVLRTRADKRPNRRSKHTSAMRQGGWYEDVRTVKDTDLAPMFPVVELPRTTLWTMILWVLGLVKRWNPWT
jgi:hypothetical protein